MDRFIAIVNALRVITRREQKSVLALFGNNFVLVSLLLLQEAGIFIYALLAIVIIFPLSSDPMCKIPYSRLSCWPLTRQEHWWLRLASPWVNPMAWVIASLVIWVPLGKITLGLSLLLAGLATSAFVLSGLPGPIAPAISLRVPKLPGPFGPLVRKDLRHILSTLDFHLAALLSASTAVVRLIGVDLSSEALAILTVMEVLALSTYTQSIFGLDGPSGLVRYRLFPLPGWKILLGKDFALMLACACLMLPLEPLTGLGALLVSLSIGRHRSVFSPRPQPPWRFCRGAPFLPHGLIQTIGIAGAASAISFLSPFSLVPCIAAWILSTWVYGRRLDDGIG